MLVRGGRRWVWKATQQCAKYSRAVAVKESDAKTIPFPRERAGLSYSLNWALAAKAIPPRGDVFHNLDDSELKKQGATSLDSVSGSTIYARGSYSTGASEITKPQFNKLFREVTQHLSSCSKLFVHDGAIGSSPNSCVTVQAIGDSPSAPLSLKSMLCPTSAQGDFPLSIYITSAHRPKAFEVPGDSYLAADYDRSALIVGGKAFADLTAMKRALAAFAAPVLVANGSLPLTARVLSVGEAKVIVAGPEAVVSKSREAFVYPETGIIWNSEGVSRLFNTKNASLPKLVSPAALVLITIDSSGALPPVSKVNPGQAAFHYLAGYDGETFTPFYNKGLASVNPVTLATELCSMLTSTNLPTYLVNISDGQKAIPDKEIMKLIEAALADKLPTSGKKISEETVKALNDKYKEYMSKTFPGLPENIKL